MQISNNVLAVLVIVAMAISISGTMTLMSTLPSPSTVTGMGTTTASGTAIVTLSQEVSMSLLISSVDFGTLPLSGSNATEGARKTAAGAMAGKGLVTEIHGLVIENIGSIEANISICWLNSTATTANGSLWVTQGNSNAYYFQYNATKNTSTTAALWYGGENETDKFANVFVNQSTGWCNAQPANLVYNLSETDGQDRVNVELNVTAPTTEAAGPKTVTVRFTAAAG